MSAVMPDGNTAALRAFEREQDEAYRRAEEYEEQCAEDMDGTDSDEIQGLVEMLDCPSELAQLICLMNGRDDLETKKAAIWDALADIKARAVEEQVACCKRNGTI